ncbi:MAG: hypothetical protein OXU20_07505 [Myxococcales bacterium]|nr:hypothetical protein [Myxococcales bacterium]MDD9966510.1 hypothetical protein [Myxococcales bacterium]
MFEFLKRWFGSRPETVEFDDERVTRTMRNGETESIRWDELREIQIVTTNEGPWVDDVFWLLLGDGVGCAVPSETVGMQRLLERLSALPGFDARAVIEAMGCTDNNRFQIWTRTEVAC